MRDLTTTLWDAAEAAQAAQVSPVTIYSWVRRGHLEVAGLDERGRKLFRACDVVNAERNTRKRAHRTWPEYPALESVA
jgi:predicted site-specific integrase-resolvase